MSTISYPSNLTVIVELSANLNRPKFAETRRGSSAETMAGDQGVMNTNDDATVCKRFAVSLGYWKDPFIDLFFHNKHPSRSERKTPEINRGYYARVQAINYLVDQFLCYVESLNGDEQSNEQGDRSPNDQSDGQSGQRSNNEQSGQEQRARKSKEVKCQIVNIGAGFDTLFWRLKAENKLDSLHSFVDLDLDGVTYRKLHQIRIQPGLLNALGEDISFNKFDLHSNTYHLISADLRNTKSLEEKLTKECKLDKSLPTLFISECVLVYLSKQHTSNFLRWAATAFEQAVLINYEQVNMEDKFGQIMIDNLRMRDCEILDLTSCRSLESQQEK